MVVNNKFEGMWKEAVKSRNAVKYLNEAVGRCTLNSSRSCNKYFMCLLSSVFVSALLARRSSVSDDSSSFFKLLNTHSFILCKYISIFLFSYS